MIKFVIPGEPASKKNSQNIVNAGGRQYLIQSDLYREYEKAALWLIPQSARQMIDYPVNIKAIYYRSTKRRVDRTNLESALLDVLTRAGVIADDNRDIAAASDGSRVYYDPISPRTEVTITELEEEYEQWAKKRRERK